MVVRTRYVILALLALAVAQPAAARPQSKLHKLDLVLREAVSQAPQPKHVIIRTKAGCRAALRRALVAHGDVIEAEHPTFDALTAYAHGEDLEALANDPCVVTVSSDAELSSSGASGRGAAGTKSRKAERRGRKHEQPDGELPPESSGLRAVLGLGPDDAIGQGITVAILDSGLEMSEDFEEGRVEFWDYTRGGVRTKPYDDYGHGTHIAGLVASAAKRHPEYGGVTPAVSLKVFKVLDKHGRGRTSQVLRAMEYIVANRHLLGIDVINLSLGHPVYEPAATDPLVQAVELAVRRGITVVVSSGNNGYNPFTSEIGYGGINSPGNAPSAITAGAANTQHTVVRRDDVVAPFSSRGPTWHDGYAKPDVVAPGVGLVSNIARRGTLVGDKSITVVDSRYASLSGSSMASAVTTGLVAAIMATNRGLDADKKAHGVHNGRAPLTPNAIKAILHYTATPLDGFDLLTQGAGEINGHGALLLTAEIDTTAAVGDRWVDLSKFDHESPVFNDPSVLGDASGRWFENIVWGTYVIDGEVLSVNSRAWDNIVWGTAFARDDNIVWGTVFRWEDDNIVWGTVRLEGDDNIVWGTALRSIVEDEDNIVWGTLYKETWADNIVWGTNFLGLDRGDNIVWGSTRDGDNIVWGSLSRDNIVWGNLARGNDNIVWGSYRTFDDNIVWGSSRGGDNIVWGTTRGDGDNIVWGTGRGDGDNIVWGTSASPKKHGKTTVGGGR